MTDGQWLFAVFASLYLLECVCWLPPDVWVFTGVRRQWRRRSGLNQFEWAGGSPLVLPLLPPLSLHVVTMPWLLVPCAKGLEIGADDAGTLVLPWDDLEPKAEGAILRLGAKQFLRLPDERLTREWQERLSLWRLMDDQARRTNFLEFARMSLIEEVPAATAARLTAATRLLRILGGVILFWTFGVITAIYRWHGDGLEIAAAGGMLVLLQWSQAIVFWRVSRQDDLKPPHRFWHVLAIAFLPQHAMRAADVICRTQPITSHPLAMRPLMAAGAWRSLAVRFWKQARHGQAQSAPLQREALEAFLRQEDVDPAALEEVPKQDADAVAYCPRCLAQYRRADARCRDCGGIAVTPWPTVK